MPAPTAIFANDVGILQGGGEKSPRPVKIVVSLTINIYTHSARRGAWNLARTVSVYVFLRHAHVPDK